MKTITIFGRALMIRLMLLLFVGFAPISTFAQAAPPTCVAMAVNPAISCPNSVATATATVVDVAGPQPVQWIINPNLSGAFFVDNGLATLDATISADGNYSTTINVGPNAGFGFTVVLQFVNFPNLQICAASPLVKQPICLASNNGPICTGDNVGLSVTGSGGTAPYTYLWTSNGAATFNDATLQNPIASGAVNGEIFTVMITDINGCTSTCTTTVIVEPCAEEGCTLGYWKNHTDRWCEAYRTCDLFGDVFVDAPSDLAGKTLLEALNLTGGDIYNLARQGVAALLNTCSDEVDYPAPYFNNPQSVISAVNAAYRAGGKESGMLAYQLDVLNNSGCPLGGTKATSATNCPR